MPLSPDPDLPPVLDARSLKPSDRREAMALWERRVDLGLENTLESVFDDEADAYALAMTEGETVVGFGVVFLCTAAGVEEYFRVSTDEYPVGETNALFHASVVDEEWEGRGLGSELMRLRVEMVREAADAAFGKAWLRPHTVDSSVLFEKQGFERLETLERGYPEADRECPDCAPEPCRCSAAVYATAFDDA